MSKKHIREAAAPSVWDVTLGGLLHDIGKLSQRAGGDTGLPEAVYARQEDVLPHPQGRPSHWHALWSDAFFDWAEEQGTVWPKDLNRHWVRDLAVYHHKPLQAYEKDPLLATTWLVTMADRAASGFERKEKDAEAEADKKVRAGFRKTPLDSITTAIRLAGDGQNDGDSQRQYTKGYYRTASFGAEALMPEAQYDPVEVEDGYKALWQEFQTGWPQIAAHSGGDPRAFEEGLLSLMERTCWAVPSSTIDQPDVSLYDHARAVAGFAAALYHHHKAREELTDIDAIRDPHRNKLRFLVGDLSGLQSTLFRLKSEQVKGLNRILRGRSLRFQLIAEMAIRKILIAFDMPTSAALQSAGGRFTLLLPELGEDTMRRKVDELRSAFDDWLAGQYCGDLGLGLALSEPFAPGDLYPLPEEKRDKAPAIRRSRKVRQQLRYAIEAAKLRQLQGPASRAVQDMRYPHGVCAACGVRPAQEEDGHCVACRAEHENGQRFPKARAIIMAPGKISAKDADSIFGGNVLLPLGEGRAAHDGELGWRFDEAAHGPAPVRHNQAYVPLFGEDEETLKAYRQMDDDRDDSDEIQAGHIKTFAALAHDSTELVNGTRLGRPMLAVLKADVDRLGQIFGSGLGERWSLARESALSRMLDGYFTIRLPWWLKQHYPDTYTVYAGGDDLFLVGPWRDMFNLARDLQEDFARFSLGNPDLTLSAGLALFDARTPISIAALEAEDRLERAKESGRNRVCAISSSPMTWPDYAGALKQAEELNLAMREDLLSTSGLYRLLSLDDSRRRLASRKSGIKNKIRPGDYVWKARLGYHLARQLPKHFTDPEQARLFGMLTRLFGLDQDLREQGYSGLARFVLTHALYRNR